MDIFAYKEIGAFDLFVNKPAKLFQVEHNGTTLSKLELNPGIFH